MMSIHHYQTEIENAKRVLLILGQSETFDFGVCALAGMLQHTSSKTTSQVIAAGKMLLALGAGDFNRGVLALAGALLDINELEEMFSDATRMWVLLPVPDIEIEPLGDEELQQVAQ